MYRRDKDDIVAVELSTGMAGQERWCRRQPVRANVRAKLVHMHTETY